MNMAPETFRQIVENSSEAILILKDLKIVYANKNALDVYGAESPDELIGKDALSIGLLTMSQHAVVQELEMKRLEGILDRGLFEFPATMKNGRKAFFEVSLSNIPFDGGIGALCFIRDISARKETETHLNSLHTSTALLGRVTTYEEASNVVLKALNDIFGLSYAAIGFVDGNNLVFKHRTSENTVDVLPLDGRGLTVRAINTRRTQVVNDISLDSDYLDGSVENSPKFSSELDVPIIVDGEPMAVIAVEEGKLNRFDLAEVQLVEILANHFASALGRIKYHDEIVEMREAHVMDLVGGIDKMCLRVQTDLKGPIHTIRNLSFIIRHNPELVPEVVDNLDNSIELMMNTLEEMKEITNPTEPEKSLTDIYQVLKAAIDLSNIPAKIDLISDFDEDFLAINVDKEKIQRVFFNIIRNAIEAMPKGGKITIEHNVKDGYVEFFLTDTGSGIPEEVLDQIFQPFFSTKPQSLGLGLSFCKLAVTSNGGSISINSEVGVGTTVILRLPV